MDGRQHIKPDKNFLKEVMGRGGDSVGKCFQCSTCTVMCPISPDDNPFPRKEMIWAQWGLKDKLMTDPDIWICQRCEDCSVHCPRDAKPGQVLAALREQVIGAYAVPGFVAKAFSSPKYLPLVLIIPVLLFMAYLLAWGDLHYPNNFVPVHEETNLTEDVEVGTTVLHLEDAEHFKAGQEITVLDNDNHETAIVASVYEVDHTVTIEEGLTNAYTTANGAEAGERAVILDDYIPDLHGDVGVMLMFVIVFTILGLGIRRFWKGLMSSPAGVARSGLTIFQSIMLAGITIIKHANFKKCETSKTVYYAHLAIVYGCIFLLLATGVTAILHYVPIVLDLDYHWESPWGILSPTKIFGIIGTVLVSAGIFTAMYRRIADPNAGSSSFSDWFLLIMICLAVLSGLATWLIRLSEWPAGTYWAYLIHIVLFFELFLFAPFTKGAHILYRLTAMTWSNYTGRGL